MSLSPIVRAVPPGPRFESLGLRIKHPNCTGPRCQVLDLDQPWIDGAPALAIEVVFVGCSDGAASVEARITGFRTALFSYGAPLKADSVQRLASTDATELKQLLEGVHPEAFVCVNDRTAGRLMKAALDLGYQIPSDLRIVGMSNMPNYCQYL